jgi:hypothetical protein
MIVGKKKRVHLFRFEEVWTKDKKCEDEVRQMWNGAGSCCTNKVNAMKSLDTVFNDYQINEVKKEIKNLEGKMKEANAWLEDSVDINRYKKMEVRHAELLHMEEVIWRQRSRAVWLKDGDRNTKFFFSKAAQRKKVNEIKSLKDVNVLWRHGEENVERVLFEYYSDLFATSDPTEIEETCQVVSGKLTEMHKDWVAAPFTKDEVVDVINQMHPLKAPGPDGLPALFFQKFWNIIAEDVLSYVLGILNNGIPPDDINQTFLALIPKNKQPSIPKDFRPISLCNVIMKIVTKVIANRIKPILPEIIDEEQSTFVHGRLITDNALVAMECFHWLKKKKGKKGMMALKLDMAKAYDRIEWSFVQSTLMSMGFHIDLVNLIMRCISSVSYEILLNGQPRKRFFPERGLRQGDPLSP